MNKIPGCVLVAALFFMGQPSWAQTTVRQQVHVKTWYQSPTPMPAGSSSGYNANRAPTVSYPGRGFDLQAAIRQQRQVTVGTIMANPNNPSQSVSLSSDANAILPIGGYGPALGYGSGGYYGYPYTPFYGAAGGNGGLFPYATVFPIPPNATPGTPLPGQVPLTGAVLFSPGPGYATFTSQGSAGAAGVTTSGTVPTTSGAGTLGTGTIINGVISTGTVTPNNPTFSPNMVPVLITPAVPGR